jgi:hypothetical protein
VFTNKPPSPITPRRGPGGPSTRFRRAIPELPVTRAPPGSPPVFPADLLDALDYAWQVICRTCDVSADLPDMQLLFEGADPFAPDQAAETVVANMLLEVMESISRFSPWYKKPMELIRVRDTATNRCNWLLSTTARQQWQALLQPLANIIEHHTGLILAGNLIEDFEVSAVPDKSRVLAHCQCSPPRVILVNRSVLDHAEIVCDTCQQMFRPCESSAADD